MADFIVCEAEARTAAHLTGEFSHFSYSGKVEKPLPQTHKVEAELILATAIALDGRLVCSPDVPPLLTMMLSRMASIRLIGVF